MTPEEEFAARSQLKWRRDGDEWVYPPPNATSSPRSRQPGYVSFPEIWGFSDISNLSWAKDAVLAQAIREVAYELANDPSKCPVKRGLQKAILSPVRFSEAAE